MPDPVEVAVETALLARAQAFATANSLQIAMPNVVFGGPAPSTTAKYLRASFMPAPSVEMGISFNSPVQHYGFMQLDVFYGQGAGELAPARIVAAIIAYFPRGTAMVSDGFTVEVIKKAYRGPIIKDDPWTMIPTTIPFICFTRPA
jgi:hypothetical protein